MNSLETELHEKTTQLKAAQDELRRLHTKSNPSAKGVCVELKESFIKADFNEKDAEIAAAGRRSGSLPL